MSPTLTPAPSSNQSLARTAPKSLMTSPSASPVQKYSHPIKIHRLALSKSHRISSQAVLSLLHLDQVMKNLQITNAIKTEIQTIFIEISKNLHLPEIDLLILLSVSIALLALS